jgi:YHS domain-containing protein
MNPVCPICGCARPIWTKEKPTIPGMYYYWNSEMKKEEFLVVQIFGNPLTVTTLTQNRNIYFTTLINQLDGEWIGPLPRPKARR